MNFIREMQPGDRVHDIYLCKQRNPAVTKNGKNYDNCILQDSSGQIDAKVWEPDSNGIDDFAAMDFVEITGDVSSFNGALQISIKRARQVDASLVDTSLYFPVSDKDNDTMWNELMSFADSVNEPHLKALLDTFFRQDTEFVGVFRKSSAAKSIHHSFIGGLLEHTLGVVKLCDMYCSYRSSLDRDLLITAAIFHDIGKTKELSPFPYNDYTDEGQFMGHIVTGAEMINDGIKKIEGFPESLRLRLIHCILAHHGEYEFGSPKKPAILEALALHYADNTDAKLQSFEEALEAAPQTGSGWLGFNRLFESNIYKSV